MLPHGYGGDRPLPDAPDRFRPAFHFSAPSGWMNDPNGLIFFAGEYHLFYQHRWPRHWGHAVSADLLHWEDLDIALAPDEVGQIWSGCVVADIANTSGMFAGGAGLVAVFTHWNDGAQHQSLASSADRGRTWQKHAANPVLPNPGLADFRDPNVFWHAPSACWVMVVAAGDHMRLLRSQNLREWQQCSTWSDPLLTACGIYECPDLFELAIAGTGETRWVLQISIGGPHVWRSFHCIGQFDGATFDAESAPIPSDYGRDSFAHTSCDAAGGRVWIAWMNNWAYASRTPTTPWQGAMTVPRVLRLVPTARGLALTQQPIPALHTLRGAALLLADFSLNGSMTLASRGLQLEIHVEIRLGTAATVGLCVAVGAGQRTTIRYTCANGMLAVERAESGERAFAREFDEQAEAVLADVGDTLTLHILLDRCSIEVFAQDGHATITSLIFPAASGDHVELFAHGGTAQFVRVEVFDLAPAARR